MEVGSSQPASDSEDDDDDDMGGGEGDDDDDEEKDEEESSAVQGRVRQSSQSHSDFIKIAQIIEENNYIYTNLPNQSNRSN